MSTTAERVKARVFRNNPDAQLLIDDATAPRAVMLSARVDIREDIENELNTFRAIREKYGVVVPQDEGEQLRGLRAESRVLFTISPNGTYDTWTTWGFDR
jgi:hypothetical protein